MEVSGKQEKVRISIDEYIGKSINMLTVIGKSTKKSSNGAYMWDCLCACGNIKSVQSGHIVRGSVFSCGCVTRTFIDLSGKKFGRWTVLGGHEIRSAGSSRASFWKCVCTCGSFSIVSSNSLRTGRSKSCGCSRKDIDTSTHGLTNTGVYKTWDTMKQRCRNKNHNNYPQYGGRGITYDPRWESFENFYEDMGERPEGMTLDRIDPDGNYTKENCRWATLSEQGYNKKLRINNTSGKTGVSYIKSCDKWSAEIHHQGRHIRLGMFVNFDDAVKARKEAELKYYGYNVE